MPRKEKERAGKSLRTVKEEKEEEKATTFKDKANCFGGSVCNSNRFSAISCSPVEALLVLNKTSDKLPNIREKRKVRL